MRHALLTVLVAAIVSFGVASLAAPAREPNVARTPMQKRVDQLAGRVSALEANVARMDARDDVLSSRISAAQATADDAGNQAACITGGVTISSDELTGTLLWGAGTEPDATLVATLDPDCGS